MQLLIRCWFTLIFFIALLMYTEGPFFSRLFSRTLQDTRILSTRDVDEIESSAPQRGTVFELPDPFNSLVRHKSALLSQHDLATDDVRLQLRQQFPKTLSRKHCTYRTKTERQKGNLKRTMNLQNYSMATAPSFLNTSSANPEIRNGGQFNLCPYPRLPTPKVAILIPYRGRKRHLKYLVNHLHPTLQRQGINYQIFVAEQYGMDTFNKGRIFNTQAS